MILSPLTSPWVAFALSFVGLIHFISPAQRSPWPQPKGPKELNSLYAHLRPSFVYQVSFIFIGLMHLILFFAGKFWSIPGEYYSEVGKGLTFLYGAPLFYFLGWFFFPKAITSARSSKMKEEAQRDDALGRSKQLILKFALFGGVLFVTVSRLHSSFLLETVHFFTLALLGLFMGFYRSAYFSEGVTDYLLMFAALLLSLLITLSNLSVLPIRFLVGMRSWGEVCFTIGLFILLRWIQKIERSYE